MRYLVNGSTLTVKAVATKWSHYLGILTTPRSGASMRSILESGLPWAIDNGAYSGFDHDGFRRLLTRARHSPRLLWVACPDVVGDAAKTLELFDIWHPELEASQYPIALVAQDGLERHEIPWSRLNALFIGGTTKFKLSETAGDLAREARNRRKLVHMGRVNSQRRLQIAFDMGCDSVDGSGPSRFGNTKLPGFVKHIHQLTMQPTLHD